ncbi:MAG: Asp-tRNA(Asn)/Glu-tRNA(Gln) amidotransferase subunit GatC [bacterium]
MLSKDEVLAVAKLARLDLNEDQLVKFQKQLEDILKLFDEVKSIDVEGVEETSQVTGLKSVTREDMVKCDPSTDSTGSTNSPQAGLLQASSGQATVPCDTGELLQNVPIKDGTNIVVPKVIK